MNFVDSLQLEERENTRFRGAFLVVVKRGIEERI